MNGHYHTFESDLRDALVAAGFIEQRLHPEVERYTRQTEGGFFSAVPWEIPGFDYRTPTIWMAEVGSRQDVYASCANDIAAFVDQFNTPSLACGMAIK